MTPKTIIVIKLSEIYERTITSRSSFATLLDKYRTSEHLRITFDFTDISFISRSSAQQLILERNEFNKRHVELNFINLEPQVSKLLSIAEHIRSRKIIPISRKKFSSNADFSEFLNSF